MALVQLPNNQGIFIHSDNSFVNNAALVSVLDAAGESRTFIGKVSLEAGSGSKTISGAGGGKIRWRTQTIVFSDAGSTFRLGIQDVNTSTGLEDGTFDVYADLVGGTDTISANADQLTTMETGSKTISQGDLIAVSFELISRGGTDSLQISAMNVGLSTRSSNAYYPYITTDTGSGPSQSASGVFGCTIEFDDGTLGWITPAALIPNAFVTASTVTFGSSSTPDEYAAVFQVPFSCSIAGGYVAISNIASADDFEIILYSNPLGTPTAIASVAIDGANIGSSSGTAVPYLFTFSTSQQLSINTTYGLAVRPTTTNTISFGYIDLGTGNEKYKRPFPFGETLKLMARTDQTGAFADTQTYYFPVFGLLIDKLDDGVPSVLPQSINPSLIIT